MFLKMLVIVSSLAGTAAASAAPSLPPPAVPSIPDIGSLRVTVKLLKPQVQAGRFCPVEMDVTNISSRPQSFRTFACSWEHQWDITDHRLSFPSRLCFWNPSRTAILKPGETFRQDGNLLVSVKPGTTRFRVVFEPVKGDRFSSSVVTLEVTS